MRQVYSENWSYDKEIRKEYDTSGNEYSNEHKELLKSAL